MVLTPLVASTVPCARKKLLVFRVVNIPVGLATNKKPVKTGFFAIRVMSLSLQGADMLVETAFMTRGLVLVDDSFARHGIYGWQCRLVGIFRQFFIARSDGSDDLLDRSAHV